MPMDRELSVSSVSVTEEDTNTDEYHSNCHLYPPQALRKKD